MPSTSSSVRYIHSHAAARPVVESYYLKSANNRHPNVLEEAGNKVSSIRPGFGESNRQSSKSIVPSNSKSQETSLVWKAFVSNSTKGKSLAVPLHNINTPMPRDFRPSDMAIAQSGLADLLHSGSPGGMRYSDTFVTRSFRDEVRGLDDSDNTALFVTCIPPFITAAYILDKITTGPTAIIPLQAATIVFNKTAAAKRLFDRIESGEGVSMGGRRLKVVYSKYGFRGNRFDHMSRVIEIEGPEELMTVDFWKTWFETLCYVECESIRFMEMDRPPPGRKSMEFRFVRIDGQAQPLLQAIKKTSEFDGVIKARYGLDPCDTMNLG